MTYLDQIAPEELFEANECYTRWQTWSDAALIAAGQRWDCIRDLHHHRHGLERELRRRGLIALVFPK